MQLTEEQEEVIQKMAQQTAEGLGLTLERKVVITHDLDGDVEVERGSSEIKVDSSLSPTKLADSIEAGVKYAAEIDSERAQLRNGAIEEAREKASYWLRFLRKKLTKDEYLSFLDEQLTD